MLMKKYNYFLFLFLTIILFINIFFLKSYKVNRFLLSSEKEYKVEGEEKLTKGKRLNSYFRRRILFFLLLVLFLVFLVIIFLELSDKYEKKVEEEEKTVFDDINLIINFKEVNFQRLSLAQNSKGQTMNKASTQKILIPNNELLKTSPNKTYVMTKTRIITTDESGVCSHISEIYKFNEIDKKKEEAKKKMRIRGAVNLLTKLMIKKINDIKKDFMLNLDTIRFVFYCCFFHKNFNDMFDENDFFYEGNQRTTIFSLYEDVKKTYKKDRNGDSAIILFDEENNFKYDDDIYYFDFVSVNDDEKKITLLSYKEGDEGDEKKNLSYFFAKEIFYDGKEFYTFEGENGEKKRKPIGVLTKKRRCFPFVTEFFGSKQKMIEIKNKLLDHFKKMENIKNDSSILNFFGVFAANLASNINSNEVEKIKAENKEKDYLYFYTVNGDYSHNKEMTKEEKEYYCKQKKDEKGFYSCQTDKKLKCKMITKTENAQGRHFILKELSDGKFYILENIKKIVDINGGVFVLPEANAFSENSTFRRLLSREQEDTLLKENPQKPVKRFQSYLDNLNFFLREWSFIDAILYKNAQRIKKQEKQENPKSGWGFFDVISPKNKEIIKSQENQENQKKPKKLSYKEVKDYLDYKYYNNDGAGENVIKEAEDKELSTCIEKVLAKSNNNIFLNFSTYADKVSNDVDKRKEFYKTEIKIRKILNKKHQEASKKEDKK